MCFTASSAARAASHPESCRHILARRPEAELLRRERQMRVKEAIFSMEPVDREIFLRYYYYLQPAPEIAEAMRLTPGAVRTRLSRGRAALKKRLSQEELLCE